MTIGLCSQHKTGVLVVAGLFLLAASCVSAKRVRTEAVRTAPVPAVSDKMPAATEIKPKDPQSINPVETGPLRITVQEAILIALENNRALAVERINPLIQQTFEDQDRAEFDPSVGAEVSYQRNDSQRLSRSGSSTESSLADTYQGRIFLKEFFPTGTFVEAEAAAISTDSSLYSDPFTSSRLGLSVTQSLLRGYGIAANLARLRQSRLETGISEYELRGFSESLLAQVENAYWDYALAQRQIEIVEESLKLARQQLVETEEMIQVGSMAEAELPALQAEVAAQQQGLINVRSDLESTRLRLLRLLSPAGETIWHRTVSLVHPPALPDVKLAGVETHVAAALRMRPEMNQTKLDIQQGDLEIVRTKNGLLPRMDLFVRLGTTGYAESFSGSLRDISGDSYDVLVGLNFEYPVFNRDAKAQHQRSLLQQDQNQKALDNLAQLVELDVRTAYIEVNRAKEQISASSATRKFQEEKLRIETEKFRVGRSTNFFVAQAQRDLLISRINEVQAVVNYLKALIGFYRQEGTLLERRGIDAPGHEPVGHSVNQN